MNYSIMFTSVTGNTEILANTILNSLPLKKCTYFGKFNPEKVNDSDLIFVGFWTDKGDCTEDVKKFLNGLENKRIAIFGTAGYGNSQKYFEDILSKVSSNISQNNKFIGSFMCAGKINEKAKEKYASNEKNNKDIEIMLQNYDNSLSHPNVRDLVNIRDFARDMYYFIQ